jgi:GAF domain-containing protein
MSAVRLRGPELLRAVAEGTAGAVGDEFLRSLVRNVAEAFGSKLAFVGEAEGEHVKVVAGWYDGGFMSPFEYDVHGAPCALLSEHPVVSVPDALIERFPEDLSAAEMGLESYLAVCLKAADGRHLGHLAVLDSRPMEAGDDDIAALRIFASRAAAELERRAQAAELAASRARVIEAGDAERMDEEVIATVDEAVAFADRSPFPSPESLYDDIYVLGDQVRGWYSIDERSAGVHKGEDERDLAEEG